ncbi:MAG: KEOPS complex subunit Pcc1 [Candidatus Hadarchaeaceae archaeon]
MKIQATVVCRYGKSKVARAVAKAIGPDNQGLPSKLWVSTMVRGNKVISSIKLEGKLETLLATLDDLLFCTLAAESVF